MRRNQRIWVAALVLAACSGQEGQEAPVGPALLPGGYVVTRDSDRTDPGVFATAETPDGLRITTGPGGIAWRPQDSIATSDFLAEATFTQKGAPMGYREGYGVFVGGKELEGRSPSYVYLMVRATGDFLIKKRQGPNTETLVDWMGHAAVQRISTDGEEPVNILGIMARGDETRFLINGTVVFVMPTEDVDPVGFAGLRVNHRLDLLLWSWSIGPAPPDPAATSPS